MLASSYTLDSCVRDCEVRRIPPMIEGEDLAGGEEKSPQRLYLTIVVNRVPTGKYPSLGWGLV